MTLSPQRAREVCHAQSQFPYWGNYEKFMTADEIAHVRGVFNAKHEPGSVTFASIVHRIARSDMHEARPAFDDIDAEIARKKLAEWDKRTGPRVGDFVHMPDGTLRRFTHDWGDGIQTTGKGEFAGDASFHFYGSCMSFSGSLDSAIPKSALVDTGETQPGRAWFFHHDHAGPHRGVYFTVPCSVYRYQPAAAVSHG